jgi:hypothetical protein
MSHFGAKSIFHFSSLSKDAKDMKDKCNFTDVSYIYAGLFLNKPHCIRAIESCDSGAYSILLFLLPPPSPTIHGQ